MKAEQIPFAKTNSFSQLMLDYLSEKEELKGFYQLTPSIENLGIQANSRTFSKEKREILSQQLFAQYEEAGIKLKDNSKVKQQIDLLLDENTFTITTGHQLCLMGGPLYFIYKIVSILKLTKELNAQYPEFNFLPVFWMASEDHDFEEISYFNFRGKKYQWKKQASGAVGRLDTEGLKEVFQELETDLPEYSGHANQLLELFRSSYLKYDNYAQASRHFVHQLFEKQGLLILDGDDVKLKSLYTAQMRSELKSSISEKAVQKSSEELGKNYKLQVNPRNINLFYLRDDSRERIEKRGDDFILVDSEQTRTASELLEELDQHPERFSPNVLLRPLYQECILPNLAYIGGGGELAYWLQLKRMFQDFEVPFPLLILRNSVLYLDQSQKELQHELELSNEQLFQRKGDLVKQWVSAENEAMLLASEKEKFHELWNELSRKTLKEDPGLDRYVAAQDQKLQNWLADLSDKLIRSKRRKAKNSVEKIEALKTALFPNASLQERHESFIDLFLIKGKDLIPELIELFQVPAKEFTILEI